LIASAKNAQLTVLYRNSLNLTEENVITDVARKSIDLTFGYCYISYQRMNLCFEHMVIWVKGELNKQLDGDWSACIGGHTKCAWYTKEYKPSIYFTIGEIVFDVRNI